METELVSETLIFILILTWPITREDFIAFINGESFKSYLNITSNGDYTVKAKIKTSDKKHKIKKITILFIKNSLLEQNY
jgi:hypothetical protein